MVFQHKMFILPMYGNLWPTLYLFYFQHIMRSTKNYTVKLPELFTVV